MSSLEGFILNQMRIYNTALRTLYKFGLQDEYPVQVDMTIENLYSSSLMLLVESRRQYAVTEMSVNVKVLK